MELNSRQGEAVLRREVVLNNYVTETPYAYAISDTRVDRLWQGVKDDLISGRLGIGEVLNSNKKETFRTFTKSKSTRQANWLKRFRWQPTTK